MLPVTSPKMNFVLRLEEAIRSKKFEYFAQVKKCETPGK